ncbi:FAD-dependent monooxygenase [Streptomyces sp. NPDC050619]|uniref:FAD-dependent monooxygenase n=1 Tax=Streptomyces sp. NPDC050619 TaxID=3157214 RepID=UPI00342C42E9
MSRTVVIAGGGPVGLMLASELSLAAVETVVIERFTEPSDYSRSLTLHARTAEVLEQRGLNRFSEYPRVASYNFGLVELQDHVEDESLLPLLVPQRDIERLLEERAAELGADIRRGQEVVGFEQDDGEVTVTVRPADGPEYRITADYLVGCDGGSSTVRKLAGIDFPGTASTADGLTADVITPLDVEEFIHPTICQPGMYASIPLRPGLHRVTAFEFGKEKTSKAIAPTVEEFQAKFRTCSGQDLGILATGEVRHLSRVGNATRLAAQYRKGRVLLAGDACHIHLPISGQGLNTGVQDALNLGWKLAAEVNGWAPAGLLDSYHAERRPVGERLCWSTSAQDGLLYPLNEVEPLRELFADLVKMERVTKHLMGTLSGLGIKYAMPAGEQRSDRPTHPLVGGRVPTGKVTTPDGEISLSDTLHTGRGVLFVRGELDLPADLATGWSHRVDLVRTQAGADLTAATLLVRPDGYVAHADDTGVDGDALRHSLLSWFGQPA